MSYTIPDVAKYHDRYDELNRHNKGRLMLMWREKYPTTWTKHPISRFSKDELINDILRAEGIIRWPDVCDACHSAPCFCEQIAARQVRTGTDE